MKLPAHGVVIAASLVTLTALADCQMPTLIDSIPDGATSSEAQLLAAQAEVRAYISAMDGYIACQNEELSANGDDATSEYLFQMTTRIESARSEVDAIATRFNDAVNAFRAARPAPQIPTPPPTLSPEPGPSPLR